MTTDVSKINDYQDKVTAFAIYPGQGMMLGLLYVALGLANEVGEVLEKLTPHFNLKDGDGGDQKEDMRLSLEVIIQMAEDCGRIKKEIRDEGTFPISPAAEAPKLSKEQRDKLVKEFGDVFWYMVGCLKELGIDAEEVLTTNYNKLASRAERGTIGGSGDER